MFWIFVISKNFFITAARSEIRLAYPVSPVTQVNMVITAACRVNVTFSWGILPFQKNGYKVKNLAYWQMNLIGYVIIEGLIQC
jgi:hypothetical protein